MQNIDSEPSASTQATAHRKTVGIIGDGQLGMLLCEAARSLAVDTLMLTSDRHCPAARCASSAVEGAMDDAEAIAALVNGADVITYEREDIPPATIAQLRSAEERGLVQCFPPLSVIELIQDKARQKRWLAQQSLATLPFQICDGSPGALAKGAAELGFPLVQKALRGGFDGRGVQLLRDAASLVSAWPGETLLEQYAGEFREVAVLVVRARDGELRHFGPVDMRFETDYSVLDSVTAPAALAPDLEEAAVGLAQRAIEAMDGVGVFGVELFVLADEQVLINEISPRVHNAGHYTLEACASSQFEQHLRAVLGLPLASTVLQHPAAMRNLLCTPALKAQDLTRGAGTESAPGDGALKTVTYWYGKSPARLMRKLGHITSLADSPAAALALASARWEQIQAAAASTLAPTLAPKPTPTDEAPTK